MHTNPVDSIYMQWSPISNQFPRPVINRHQVWANGRELGSMLKTDRKPITPHRHLQREYTNWKQRNRTDTGSFCISFLLKQWWAFTSKLMFAKIEFGSIYMILPGLEFVTVWNILRFCFVVLIFLYKIFNSSFGMVNKFNECKKEFLPKNPSFLCFNTFANYLPLILCGFSISAFIKIKSRKSTIQKEGNI